MKICADVNHERLVIAKLHDKEHLCGQQLDDADAPVEPVQLLWPILTKLEKEHSFSDYSGDQD